MDKSKENEKDIYQPLLYFDEKDDDEEEYDEIIKHPKCFAFKIEIKTFIKYAIKECPKIF